MAKAKELSKELDTAFSDIKSELEELLKLSISDENIEYIQYLDSELYVFPPKYRETFDSFASDLAEIKDSETRKVKKLSYSLNKIVNIINPKNDAYQYDLTTAKKYVYISDLDKCFDEAGARVSISSHVLRKNLEKFISDNQGKISDYIIEEEKAKIEKQIKEELEAVENILKNRDIVDSIRISGYKNLINYGQVNYGYYDTKKVDKFGRKYKVRTNAHLSVVFPNILFYEADKFDTHKSDMEAKYLEEQGYTQLCRDVFVKYKTGTDSTNSNENNEKE